ncbi:MAG: tetratricopeptide repeat protein [Mucilaginibacter sp.]
MLKRLIQIPRWIINGCLLSALLLNSCFAQTSKINEIRAKLKVVKEDTARLKLLKQLADAYTPVDPVQKFYYANVFKALAEKLHDEQSIADAYVQMGISYGMRSKLDSALIYFQTAYNQSKKINYLFGMGKSLSDIGFVYDRLDEKKEAIKADFQALEIIKKTNNLRAINQLYTNIGSIYFDLRQYKLAETYFNQCLVNSTASKDSSGMAYAFFTMGNCFQALKEDDKAMDYFSRSLAIRERLGDVNGVALVKRGLGNVYFHKKQYSRALTYLDTAFNTVKKLQDKYEESAILLDLSDVYLGMKDFDKAIDCASRSLTNCREIKSQSGVAEALQRLVTIYKSKGDIARAFEYQSQYITTQDGIETAKALKDVTLTEFGRIRAENATLAKNNQRYAVTNTSYVLKLNQYSTVIAVIAAILALVVLLLYVLYRLNLEKLAANRVLKQQKEEIADINHELEALNEELNAQMELTNEQNEELEKLNNVKNKLFSIISHDLRSPLSTLQTLLRVYRDGDISDEELGELLIKLEDTILSTGTFLDNLLEWSKSQFEGMVIKPEQFNIADCVAENIRLFATQSVLKKLKISNKADPLTTVYADRNMIGLVIRNLFSNSIKFCNPGDEIIFETASNNGKTIITVSDTGPGINESDRDKLFDIEHTVTTGTQGEKGSHLGLILCRDMVIQNQGKIWFETETGKGTTFWVELPSAQ